MRTDHSGKPAQDSGSPGPDNDWVGAYGFGGHHGPGYEPQPGEKRDFWDRAADQFAALFGDEDAAQRLQQDRIHARARRKPDPNH